MADTPERFAQEASSPEQGRTRGGAAEKPLPGESRQQRPGWVQRPDSGWPPYQFTSGYISLYFVTNEED
ncbi:MAG TPA: hypothetical protein VNE67_18525, partial [Acetobacteraceae bacterium]|nr:hypothetical protein [Acetobacteraceae bacterium]